ncbi:transmembrane protein 237 [Onthophagus taurus]|uniref:transmembrane protein 237 n=1 Tax=Onthophagus taurus TaxID=166361 RepID=UPI0039BE5B8E
MTTKTLSRSKKLRSKDEIVQEIVPQVHKPTRRDTSSDRDTQRTDYSEESLESNKNYLTEDKNENYTSSKELTDSETHKNSNKTDSDSKKDSNKHSHFTDSRPQSLSFYEDEKIPEELSGNLELLSPEEKKHYKRRNDERNIYNSIQDIYGRDGDEIIPGQFKKSKSRKKKHECEQGMGDSRELMIPKEKKKSKKKKRENSPINSSKKKHRKRDEEYEPKTEITLALEELQDDVFENNIEDFIRHEKVRKSPRKSDKMYIQKKNRFEPANKTSLLRPNIEQNDSNQRHEDRPIEIAQNIQKRWMPFTTFCHGLLGGLAFAHFAYIHSNRNSNDSKYIIHYSNYSDIYTCTFYLLCTICLISVFDRYDIANISKVNFKELIKHRKSCAVVILYVTTMLVHLFAAKVDDKMSLIKYANITELNMTPGEISEWYNLSLGRAIFAFISWIVVSMVSTEDSLSIHLKESF